MARYSIRLEGGRCGEKPIIAKSMAEAARDATAWAWAGDWPNKGCTIDVTVVNVDDVNDCASWTIEIGSKDVQKAESGEEIGSDEGEWDTRRLMRIEDEYFLIVDNGGSGGARDRQRGDGSWPDSSVIGATAVSRNEARRLLLEWGLESKVVAQKTKESGSGIVRLEYTEQGRGAQRKFP